MIVLLFLAGYLYYLRARIVRRMKDVVLMPTSTISSLAADKGRKMVEIKGKLVAGGALFKAPYSGRECLFYHSVRRDLIEKASRKIERGKKRQFGYLTIEEFRSEEIFYVDDGTGKIAVDPKDLTIYGHKVIDGEESIINVEDDGVFGAKMPHANSEGILKEEQILVPGRRVYVMGELTGDRGIPCIRAPHDGNQTAMLSLRTEETILEEMGERARTYTIGIAITIFVALAVLLYAF